VASPSWTMRLLDRSSGVIAHMIRASEPPMNVCLLAGATTRMLLKAFLQMSRDVA